MPTECDKLTLSEVSLVDDPANEGAKVSLFKRANPPDSGTETEADMADDDNTIAELTKTNAALAGELAKMKEKMKGKMDGKMDGDGDGDARMSDKDKMRGKKMQKSIDELAAFIEAGDSTVAKHDDGSVKITKRAADDYVMVGESRILKSSVPAAALAVMVKQNDALEGALGAMARADLVKRADSDLALLGGTQEQRIALLKAVDAIADDPVVKGADGADTSKSATRDGVLGLLKGLGVVAKNGGFGELGTADPNVNHTPATAAAVKLDELAKAAQSDHDGDYYKAYDAVMKTAEGRKLFAAQGRPAPVTNPSARPYGAGPAPTGG